MVPEMENEQWTVLLHLLQKYQRMNEHYYKSMHSHIVQKHAKS
jgi:hypothetical protein